MLSEPFVPDLLPKRCGKVSLHSTRVAVIGDNPEAVMVAVLLAENGQPCVLLTGNQFPTVGQGSFANGADESHWLLQIHSCSGTIQRIQRIEDLHGFEVDTIFLTDHAENGQENSIEIRVRKLAPIFSRGQVFIYTGLSPPSFTGGRIRPLLTKQTGLRIGDGLGLCYLPLLWSGESLAGFKEVPRIIAGEGPEHLRRAQEVIFSLFPSLSVAPSLAVAEATGLFRPVYREVLRALELEMIEMCLSRKVDFSTVMKLSSKTVNLPGLGVPHTSATRDLIGSRIALDVLGNPNRPLLMRTARRINDEAPQQVLGMVKDALGRCGRGIRRSRIAILGVDGLGVDPASGIQASWVISNLVKRGALVSLYPGEKKLASQGASLKLRIEPDLTRAVQKAQCAIVALKPSKREISDLNPQKLAAEMDRPAVICDLARVLEPSNVERSGLFYSSLGRGITGP